MVQSHKISNYIKIDDKGKINYQINLEAKIKGYMQTVANKEA